MKDEMHQEQQQEIENQVAAQPHFCALPAVKEREFNAEVNPDRARLILESAKKWVNGTVLHYYFFDKDDDGQWVFFNDGTREWRTWQGGEAEKNVVRKAFEIWKEVGIGLEFREVDNRRDGEVRIGFMKGNGSWSYIGRDIWNISRNDRTMNFGWDIGVGGGDIDTALHEIGHTLGFPHEHQNPNAGIVWDEEVVYSALAAPPNRWDRNKTFNNIIRKINPDIVQGSNWDPNSIMHYPFSPGLIRMPAAFNSTGIRPRPGLSERDKTWVKHFYPPLKEDDYMELTLLQSQTIDIQAGEQKNFVFIPDAIREYSIQTFGQMDTVMIIFQEIDGELVYIDGDDDSGFDRNAFVKLKLIKGNKYIIRLRLFFKESAGSTAIMIW